VGKQARGLRLELKKKKKTEKLIKSRKLEKINQKNQIIKKN
jgi:hypothetical protein